MEGGSRTPGRRSRVPSVVSPTVGKAKALSPPECGGGRSLTRHSPVRAEELSLAQAEGFFENEDLVLEIFSYITCSLTLRRAGRACKLFHRLLSRAPQSPSAHIWQRAWLDVTEVCAAALLRHAPAGERVRIRRGSALHGELVIGQPLHVVAEPGVTLHGKLHLLGVGARDVESWEGMDFLSARLGGVGAIGIVEGIDVRHFMVCE